MHISLDLSHTIGLQHHSSYSETAILSTMHPHYQPWRIDEDSLRNLYVSSLHLLSHTRNIYNYPHTVSLSLLNYKHTFKLYCISILVLCFEYMLFREKACYQCDYTYKCVCVFEALLDAMYLCL